MWFELQIHWSISRHFTSLPPVHLKWGGVRSWGATCLTPRGQKVLLFWIVVVRERRSCGSGSVNGLISSQSRDNAERLNRKTREKITEHQEKGVSSTSLLREGKLFLANFSLSVHCKQVVTENISRRRKQKNKKQQQQQKHGVATFPVVVFSPMLLMFLLSSNQTETCLKY